MGRVVNTNSPGKRRNFHMRTIAELLRRLGQQSGVDDETKDMIALIAFSLREIDKTILESITAWEKRNYWKKADEFQQKWWWTQTLTDTIEKMMREETWEQIPDIMMKLFPHFADTQVNKMLRSPDLWSGAYDRFLEKDNA